MKVPKYGRALLLGVIASLLAIYFIASQMNDVGKMWTALRSADYRWILVSMGIIVIGLFARGARWRALLDGALPFWRSFSITNVSYLLSGVLPLRLGEVARVYLAMQAQPPVPAMKSISTILVERLIDLLSVLLILALALSGGPLPDQLRATATFVIPVVVIGFMVLIFLASQRAFTLRLAGQIFAKIPVLQRWNLLGWLEQFLDGLKPLTQPSALAQVIPFTIASWLCSLGSGYVLMIAFFGHGDWATTCLFSAAASLAVAVPAVPGNLGTYELSIMLALGAMGYGEPAATATAFAIAVHAVNLLVNSTLGVYGFIQEGISLDQLSHGVREMRKPSG
ncbi:MAG TPA: lysylphosphatidylglycerol synthase transmembrane domain-containing protein [Phototrophicaceae bacterium]|nr:lysylphosphatidylglycerol synthase transmembrane domain-containing protein [Phototrophicaceae bacterium]